MIQVLPQNLPLTATHRIKSGKDKWPIWLSGIGVGDYNPNVGVITVRIYDISVNPLLPDSLF
jgi:hypothetical protein